MPPYRYLPTYLPTRKLLQCAESGGEVERSALARTARGECFVVGPMGAMRRFFKDGEVHRADAGGCFIERTEYDAW